MATNCEDISAQMIELLYGELPADARASVDAHVAGCARCRSELDGFERTRAIARRGLDEAPPARARAAIMQAAAAHLAARAQPAAQAQTVAQAQAAAPGQPPARKAVAPDKVSFWDKLRARWAFPTLATVGALVVFLFANQLFQNPERTLDRMRGAQTEEAPAGAPTPPAQAIAPASPSVEPIDEHEAAPRRERNLQEAQAGARYRPEAKPAPVAAIAEPPKAPAKSVASAHLYKDSAMSGEKHAAKKGAGVAKSFAAPPPRAAAPRDELLDGRFAPPPPPREERAAVKRKAPTSDSLAELDDGRAASAPTRRPAPSTPPSDKALGDVMASAPKTSVSMGGASGVVGGGAAAPRGKADGFGSGAAQAAPAAAAPRPAPARPEAAQRTISAPVPAPAATAAAPPPPPAAQPASKLRAKKSEASPSEGFAADEEGQAKEEKKQSNARSTANDNLLLRAERLFAEGRWNEAAALYRELLRRDPRNEDAERWRRRLVAAEANEVSERNANLAEKRSAEAQERARKAAPAKPAKRSDKAAASDAAQ